MNDNDANQNRSMALLRRVWLAAPFVFFPRRCAWCGGVTEAAGALCPPCEAAYAGAARVERQRDTVSCYFYRDPARRQFFALKFNGRRGLAPSIGRTMAEALLAANPADMPELVCCVPMTDGQCRARGYNQSALLARHAARHLALPFAPELLRKTRETGTQHGLPADRREANVAGAFAAAEPDKCRGRRILLCDDVITTGATLRACRQALLDAGAAQVTCLTFLQTRSKRQEARLSHHEEYASCQPTPTTSRPTSGRPTPARNPGPASSGPRASANGKP